MRCVCVLMKARVDIRYLSTIIVHFIYRGRVLLWESLVFVFSALVLQRVCI